MIRARCRDCGLRLTTGREVTEEFCYSCARHREDGHAPAPAGYEPGTDRIVYCHGNGRPV